MAKKDKLFLIVDIPGRTGTSDRLPFTYENFEALARDEDNWIGLGLQEDGLVTVDAETEEITQIKQPEKYPHGGLSDDVAYGIGKSPGGALRALRAVLAEEEADLDW